jgi:hypothetical protein
MRRPDDTECGLLIAAGDCARDPRDVDPERTALRRVAARHERAAERRSRCGWVGRCVAARSFRVGRNAEGWLGGVLCRRLGCRALGAHRLLDGGGAAD